MKTRIYHIYWGTAGNAGLYLDEIYQVLSMAGYKQRVFVSYYYPFRYGDRIFFKRTEMEHSHYKGKMRKIVMGLELLLGLSKVLVCSLIDKPDVINYSYAGWGNGLIYWFLKLIRKCNRGTLIITCHDVVPSVRNKAKYEKELSIKQKIYNLADYFIVHNANSIDDIKRVFGINLEKVLLHPFPLMDLSKLDSQGKTNDSKYDFLFIGHLRREKGIELLFEAWPLFHKMCPEASLCIAGNATLYEDFINKRRTECVENNIILNLGFIKDKDYIEIIKSSNCVVFPYTAGTNSGVISTVISLGRNVITSDIGMFVNNPLVHRDSIFETGNINSFVEKLKEFYGKTFDEDNHQRIEKYREEFQRQVINVYSAFDRAKNDK